MSLLVLNCRGLANPQTIRFLKEIIKKIRPTLIFMFETLVKWNKVIILCKLIHFAGCFVVDVQGHGRGLALLWKNEKGVCSHLINFEVYYEQVGWWRYTWFYGCPDRGRREESLYLIRDLASRSSLTWCIFGDFNDIMFDHEKAKEEDYRELCWKILLRLWMIVG